MCGKHTLMFTALSLVKHVKIHFTSYLDLILEILVCNALYLTH